MISSARSNSVSYTAALLAVGAAAVLTHLLWRYTEHAPAPLFVVAVAFSAWLGGLGPGLTATLASFVAVAGLCVMLGDIRELSVVEILRIVCLIPVALFIGLLYSGKRRAEQSLQERDDRLQLVSEQIPGGLWSTDDGLMITSGFGAQSALLHGPAGTSLLEHFKTQDPGFAPIAAHQRALRGESNNYELQWAGRTFQCYVEPLRGTDGGIIGVVGVATDMTERKQSEEERERLVKLLEEQRQRLDTTNRAKDRFLAMLSHELRTPLSPVLTLSSELETREDLPQEVREDLGMIKRNVELEATLIDDLLDLTRIARGKLQLQFATVDVHELIQNVIEICQSDAHRKRVELVLQLEAAGHWVRGDAARLQQVFWNLLKNAVKFTAENGRVVVRTFVEGDQLQIEVTDNGIGIDAEHLPLIFDAFEQGSEAITRQFGGLGLGLAISKALVESHKGYISAHSEGPGTGASFRIQLQPVEVEPRETRSGGDVHAVARQLKILVVEDHADTAKVLSRLLKASGHTVSTATTVASALHLLELEPIDLMISDLGLPDGNGMDLMRQVSERYGLKGIALSGYGTEDDVQKALQAGFAAHLTKPVPVATLRQTVARVSSAN